ncbi:MULTISPECIES: Lon protease family protein [Methylococcus]|uniref:endopeptidase La n=1 Tax=Methylococcus capsulatus (strain ATCC 33009 / NCIMB 11132 / Bath) TaxID=243233 RepID=Q604E5_METCA|nr:ATP-binding protein [Methylococcus capsulatus]AAU91297.1 putative ATP-dependent protease [Methylococcus capsulatus str. Bath]QXP91811.1 AAA family ATPase [Methylococcus capsulatus]
MSRPPAALPAAALNTVISPDDLPFDSTAELEPLDHILGQQRAQEAIDVGLAMRRPGYNLYVMGDPGTGRLSLVKRLLERRAAGQPAPNDWLYLNRFDNPREPVAISLPAGMARRFAADVETFVDSLLATFPAAFDNPAYQRRRTAIDREFSRRFDEAVEAVGRKAEQRGILLFRDGDDISFAPRGDGAPLDEAAFAALPEAKKAQFHAQVRELEDDLHEALLELPQWKREASESLRALNRETIEQAAAPLLARLSAPYAGCAALLAHISVLGEHLDRTVTEYLLDDRGQDPREEAIRRNRLLDRYAPCVLVSHDPEGGTPVLFAPNPSYPNLFGRIEPPGEQDASHAHARLIFPGLLHQANGGCLIVEAEQLVGDAEAWPALKRAFKSGQLRIEPRPADAAGGTRAQTLLPAPIPLEVKLALVGTRDLYYLLETADPDFKELFRLPVDFDDHFPLTPASMLDFARLIKSQAAQAGHADVSACGIAALLEYGARLAEHQNRLSARMGDVCEVLAEADLERRREAAVTVRAEHVRRALAARERRLDRLNQELLDDVMEGVLLIATEGEKVGCVNGLTVLEAGETCFATPARITATVSPGERGVVDIEREAELGQAIHSKGVLILSGCLAFRYARDFPLALSAHLAIEQSYGYIDGDSASLGEFCALVSALTGIPIRQTLAVTGSMNQHGEVQAVGGVNEKIEGFFRLCRARGFTGDQGVIIPTANVRNLMLKAEVADAVSEGKFAVYAVHTVDEALELMTGKAARTVNRLAVSRLKAFADCSEKKT